MCHADLSPTIDPMSDAEIDSMVGNGNVSLKIAMRSTRCIIATPVGLRYATLTDSVARKMSMTNVVIIDAMNPARLLPMSPMRAPATKQMPMARPCSYHIA